MAKIKVTSANIDTRAGQWLNNPGTDTLVFYDEAFKYDTNELIRLAFNAGHIVKVVPLEGKLKEVQYVSGTIV
jgi:hypothetical protein